MDAGRWICMKDVPLNADKMPGYVLSLCIFYKQTLLPGSIWQIDFISPMKMF